MIEAHEGEIACAYRGCYYRYTIEAADDMREIYGIADFEMLCRKQIDTFLKLGAEPGFRLRLSVGHEPVIKDDKLESRTISLSFTKVYE